MNLMPDFRCHRPATLEEAVRLKAASAGTRFLAGGTDLLVNLRRGLGEPSDLIDLTAVADFAVIRRDGDRLRLGAGVTLAALARHRGSPRLLSGRWPRRRWRSPAPPIGRPRLWAAICARTRAASSTTRANGGARSTAIV